MRHNSNAINISFACLVLFLLLSLCLPSLLLVETRRCWNLNPVCFPAYHFRELSDCNKARLSLQEANDVLGRTNVTQTETLVERSSSLLLKEIEPCHDKRAVYNWWYSWFSIENLERDRKALAANKDTMVQEKESLNKELAMLRVWRRLFIISPDKHTLYIHRIYAGLIDWGISPPET